VRGLLLVAVLTLSVDGPTALCHGLKPELPACKNYQGVVVRYT